MEIKTAQEIIEENFKGLDDLIEDEDLLHFYKSLIKECMLGYAEQFIELAIEGIHMHTDQVEVVSDLLDIKQLIK